MYIVGTHWKNLAEALLMSTNKIYFLSVIRNIFTRAIALDKALFSTKNYLYFSYFLTKTYVVSTY